MQSLINDLIDFDSEDIEEQLASTAEEKTSILMNTNDNHACIIETKIKNTEIETTANTPFCFFVSDANTVSNDKQNKSDTDIPSNNMKSSHG